MYMSVPVPMAMLMPVQEMVGESVRLSGMFPSRAKPETQKEEEKEKKEREREQEHKKIRSAHSV